MYKLCGAAALALLTVSLAHGHFPFILPDDKGATVKVVFSDSLEPDKDVNIEKLANTKLTLVDESGKETKLAWTKGDGCYEVAVPGSGTRVVYGVTEYGVLQKGDAKPFKLTYYPKAVIGSASAKAIGATLPLEVAAAAAAGKVKFQVLAAGKPLAGAEVTIILPDGAKKSVTTAKDGFTPEYTTPGRYGVYAKQVEAKSGDHAGKKYDETRNYATLVCDVPK